MPELATLSVRGEKLRPLESLERVRRPNVTLSCRDDARINTLSQLTKFFEQIIDMFSGTHFTRTSPLNFK